MADLGSLEGIGEARNDLYNKLEAGTISEIRAAGMERILRGQENLKATQPIRLLNVITKLKGTTAERYVGPLIERVLVFTGGQKALEESSGSKK